MNENRVIGTDTKGKGIAGMENVEDVCIEGHASSSSSSSIPRKQSGNEIDIGESSEAAGESANPLLPESTQVGENMGIFMFEMTLTQSNVEQKKLKIPGEIASDFFHPLFDRRNNLWVNLYLTDPENLRFSISLWFSSVGNSFAIDGRWWQRFVHRYNAEAMDVIRFYKAVQTAEETDILIELVKTGTQEIMSCSISKGTQVGENMGNFLFEICLTQSDIERGRLSVPLVLASTHFPPLATRQNDYASIVQITDPDNVSLKLLMQLDSSERAYVNESDLWKEFVHIFKLGATDLIRFHIPVSRAHPYHFLVDFVRSLPEFNHENFLFELELRGNGIRIRRLFIPTEEVRNHFPCVNQNQMRMRFTDAQNKSWVVKIIFVSHTYMLVPEDDFVIDNDMKHGDVIRFYKPVRPLHRLHYLIEFVKKHPASTTDPTPPTTDPTPPATDPTQSGNPEDKKQDGRRKQRGGRKGKKFAFGDCCVT